MNEKDLDEIRKLRIDQSYGVGPKQTVDADKNVEDQEKDLNIGFRTPCIELYGHPPCMKQRGESALAVRQIALRFNYGAVLLIDFFIDLQEWGVSIVPFAPFGQGEDESKAMLAQLGFTQKTTYDLAELLMKFQAEVEASKTGENVEEVIRKRTEEKMKRLNMIACEFGEAMKVVAAKSESFPEEIDANAFDQSARK